MVEETWSGGRRGEEVAYMTWVGHDGTWGHMVARPCRCWVPKHSFVCTGLMG